VATIVPPKTRVLTVDDEDAGTTADTTYTYSLTSPSWTDPTGSYAATLDPFHRAVSLTDPASASAWTWTYGTGSEFLSGTQGNGNTIAQAFDAAGHLLTRTTKTGLTSRAHYVYTYNRAGMILSEASTVTGDPANGTVAYGYDPLGQLTGSTFSGTTTAYGWDTTTNRTSIQVGGGTAATTSYDAANRPTSGANPTAAYTSDADGRLTARPNQTMTWDHLGRLTAVKDAAGTVTLAATTYDPLDRLRTVDDGGGTRIRFRYTGLTTSAAQWLDDVAGTVTRNIGNGWGGERLLDWTGTSSNRRYYGANLHHDVTWLAADDGTVSQSLRYDPWGTPRSTVPQDYTPFRFQGSWYDQETDLSWVVTRWYAPSLGRFVSEDTLLGEPREPDSRHLYAYAAGEPVGAWDPDGTTTISAAIRAAIAFARYYTVRDYIFGEMKRNADGSRFGWWRGTTSILACVVRVVCSSEHNVWVLLSFGSLVHGALVPEKITVGRIDIEIRGGLAGDWDHKPKLKRLVGVNHKFYTPIGGDTVHERLRFDVWSNIHYGYVGRSHGIPADILRAAANSWFAGQNSPADRLSVNLGIRLWGRHGRGLTASQLEKEVRDHMFMYSKSPDAVRPGWWGGDDAP
jgi:RHS repeat-associated protein